MWLTLLLPRVASCELPPNAKHDLAEVLARFHQPMRFFRALERQHGVDHGADASRLEIGAEAFQEGVDDGGFLFDGRARSVEPMICARFTRSCTTSISAVRCSPPIEPMITIRPSDRERFEIARQIARADVIEDHVRRRAPSRRSPRRDS